jgi:hypothetical protein
VVQIWPGQTVTCLHTISPGHIWTTLYIAFLCVVWSVYVDVSEEGLQFLFAHNKLFASWLGSGWRNCMERDPVLGGGGRGSKRAFRRLLQPTQILQSGPLEFRFSFDSRNETRQRKRNCLGLWNRDVVRTTDKRALEVQRSICPSCVLARPYRPLKIEDEGSAFPWYHGVR